MANITSVHVTSGIPDGGTGTVSTIDELILVGLPLTGGTTTVSGTMTAVVSGTTFVSGGTVTAQISGGTSFVSGGTVTSTLNQNGATLSVTNGLWANVMFNNAIVSASVGLPVNLVTYAPLTAIVSGTTFISGGTVTTQISGGTSFLSGGTVTASINQGGAALSSTNGDFSNVLFNNTMVTSGNGLPVNLVSGSITIGNVTAAINQGGAAVSSTNGSFFNILFNNALVSASVGLPVNLLTYAVLTAVISGTTFISGGTVTAVVSGTTVITSGNVTAAINQGGNALSSTNGVYANILFNNALVSASVGLPVNLVTYAPLTAVISGTAFLSGGNVTAVVSGTTVVSGSVNATAAINQGGSAVSSTNGSFFNILFNNALVSASVGLPINLVTYINLTAVVSGTTFISGGTVTSVVSGTTFISGGNATTVINQAGAALSSTNGIFANILIGNAAISSTNPVMVEGDTASGQTDANNPVKIGGLAKSAQPTGVLDGQRVAALYDLLGRQITAGSIRNLKANFYTSIATTGETALVTAISTAFIDVYGAICTNKSGSTILMTFKDSTGGSTQYEFNVPSFDTRGFMVSESGAIKQTAENTQWTVTPSLATSISVTLLYVKNATA